MRTYATEKSYILKRLKELELMIGNDSGKNDTLAEELSKLKRMEEILDNHNIQKTETEYLELRSGTSLPMISPLTALTLIDASSIRKAEKERIDKEIDLILSRGIKEESVIASDKRSVPKGELNKYEALLKMQSIAEHDFITNDFYEYRYLLEKAGLYPLEEYKYTTLLGMDNESELTYEEYKKKHTSDSLTNSNEALIINEDNRHLNLNDYQKDPNKIDTLTTKEVQIVKPNLLDNYDSSQDYEHDDEAIPVDFEIVDAPPGYQKPDVKKNAIDVDYREVVENDSPDPTGDWQTPEIGRKNEKSNLLLDSPHTKEKEDEEELIEVVKTSPWKWVKKHKKQILIALGLSALTLSLVVIITQLLPAIVASAQATQVAGMAAEMAKNATLHHTAIASEKLALHGANTALANVISSITGIGNSFNTATGIWTFGSETLAEYVGSSLFTAKSAAQSVVHLSKVAATLGIGGTGLLGVGLLSNNKKQKEEYKSISQSLKNLEIASSMLSSEDQNKTAQILSNKILESSLSEEEKTVLLQKLKNVVKNSHNIDQNQISNRDNTKDEKKIDRETIDEDIQKGIKR